jgi:oligopeptide transport system substrate-binding protein
MVKIMNKLSAKILASVLTASMVFAGCSNAASSAAPASSTAPAASSAAPAASSSTAAPEQSTAPQEITVAISSQIANLDTGLNSTTHIAQILEQVSGGLFYSDAHGALQNDLCEDYTISPDGLTYTFKIKQGIKWSDGKPLTAHDWVTVSSVPSVTAPTTPSCLLICADSSRALRTLTTTLSTLQL